MFKSKIYEQAAAGTSLLLLGGAVGMQYARSGILETALAEDNVDLAIEAHFIDQNAEVLLQLGGLSAVIAVILFFARGGWTPKGAKRKT